MRRRYGKFFFMEVRTREEKEALTRALAVAIGLPGRTTSCAARWDILAVDDMPDAVRVENLRVLFSDLLEEIMLALTV